MDALAQNSGSIISILLSAAIAVVYFFDRRKSGQDTINANTINGYKQQVEQLESHIDSYKEDVGFLTNKVSELTRAVGQAEGVISEKDKQIEALTKLVQGRNPEMTALFTELKLLMQRISVHLESNEREMTKQTQLLTEAKDRYTKIDAAHGLANRAAEQYTPPPPP
jgi:chromosome segregation ATPase